MGNVIGKSLHITKRLHRELANDSLSASQEIQIAFRSHEGAEGRQRLEFSGAPIKDLVYGYDSIRRQNI